MNVPVQYAPIRGKRDGPEVFRVFLIGVGCRCVLIKILAKISQGVPRRKDHITLVQGDMQRIELPNDLPGPGIVRIRVLSVDQPRGLQTDGDASSSFT